MTKNIGFYGGGTIGELGPRPDVVAFYECLRIYVAEADPGTDYSLLTDRLYRRYLGVEELDPASALMARAQAAFARVSTTQVDWANIGRDPAQTRLDLAQSTLASLFSRYFRLFDDCVWSAKRSFSDWKDYAPVMTIISDLPESLYDTERPLEDYDKLVGQPFWLRGPRQEDLDRVAVVLA